jgi:hypothetical protein
MGTVYSGVRRDFIIDSFTGGVKLFLNGKQQGVI